MAEAVQAVPAPAPAAAAAAAGAGAALQLAPARRRRSEWNIVKSIEQRDGFHEDVERFVAAMEPSAKASIEIQGPGAGLSRVYRLSVRNRALYGAMDTSAWPPRASAGVSATAAATASAELCHSDDGVTRSVVE